MKFDGGLASGGTELIVLGCLYDDVVGCCWENVTTAFQNRILGNYCGCLQ